jgi:hypothetical protein
MLTRMQAYLQYESRVMQSKSEINVKEREGKKIKKKIELSSATVSGFLTVN